MVRFLFIVNAAVAFKLASGSSLEDRAGGDPYFNVLLQQVGIDAGYGCWCKFDGSPVKGLPVDPVDEACRKLHGHYECLIANDASCSIFNATLVSPALTLLGNEVVTPEEIQTQCNNFNSLFSDCTKNICAVEAQFFVNYLDHIQLGELAVKIDDQYKHENFDYKSGCRTRGGTSDASKKCCGVAPYQVPYKPLADINGDDQRLCCLDAMQPYLQDKYVCCGNRVVSVFSGEQC